MVARDIRHEFLVDTGNYAPMVTGEKITHHADKDEYIEWLEEQLLYIRNKLRITAEDIVRMNQFDTVMEDIRKTLTIVTKKRYKL